MFPHARVLHALLDEAATRWPGRPAVTCRGRTLDYQQLDEASRRLGSWLSTCGLRRGDRLVVCAPGSAALIALVYAASRLGVVFTLLHEQVRGGQLEHVLADAEPTLLVTEDEDALAVARLRGIRTATTESVETLVYGTVPPESPGVPRSGQMAESSATGPLPVDPVCLIYTSGTTSLPKAVVTTHQQLTFAVDAIQGELGYRSDDVVYSMLPLSFDYGLYQFFLAARAGAHVWLGRSGALGPPLVATLMRSGATVLPVVPSVAEALVRLLSRPGTGVPAIRLVTSTGAAMPVTTLRGLRASLPGLTVQVMFGLTECKRAAIMPPDGDLERPGSSGRALPGTEVFVIDDDGRRLPPGEVGEIVVRGPHVMSGYWRRPQLTDERFPRSEGLFPELRTGDYGRLDEEGFVYVEGRRDDIYKENGFRVSATEVEAAARGVTGVSSAAVLTPRGSEPALLFAVAGLPAGEVLRQMQEQIEQFKIPGRCVVVDRLPLTRNGKIDRKALSLLAEEMLHARSA